MDIALDSSNISSKCLTFLNYNPRITVPIRIRKFPRSSRSNPYTFRLSSPNAIELKSFRYPTCKATDFGLEASISTRSEDRDLGPSSEVLKGLLKRGVVLAAMVCGVLVCGSQRALASEGLVSVGFGDFGQSVVLAMRNAWPKTLQVLQVLKEQGIVLALLLGLSAFFSMAETSITTLWPWKVSNPLA